MKHPNQRNWSQYNQRLKQQARIELFVSPDVVNDWYCRGPRRPGGVRIYSDSLIEACLLLREYFGLALRQTQGFVESLIDRLGLGLRAPDYTTLSRRCAGLRPVLGRMPPRKEGLVIAIDSTGLSVHSRHEWNRLKHGEDYVWKKKWRKLHIAVDTQTGLIASAAYSEANVADSARLEDLLADIDAPVSAVCADMAYDHTHCRQALYDRGIRQLIPPNRVARTAAENRNQKTHAAALKERDDAILYIRHNAINGCQALARAAWKQKAGYHARSRVETTFAQLKTHASGKLTNRLETTRNIQALLKCKLVNTLTAA